MAATYRCTSTVVILSRCVREQGAVVQRLVAHVLRCTCPYALPARPSPSFRAMRIGEGGAGGGIGAVPVEGEGGAGGGIGVEGEGGGGEGGGIGTSASLRGLWTG